MSFEPHYINTCIILLTIITIICMLFYSIFVLFMDAIERDETIINEPYVKLPKRRKRKRHSF